MCGLELHMLRSLYNVLLGIRSLALTVPAKLIVLFQKMSIPLPMSFFWFEPPPPIPVLTFLAKFCSLRLPFPSLWGVGASWLVRSSLDQVVWVWALARETMLCSWARHLTLTVPLSTQEYRWVQANCWGNLTNCGGVTCSGLASHPGGVEVLLAASCFRNRDKLRHLWASWLQGFTFSATCMAIYWKNTNVQSVIALICSS